MLVVVSKTAPTHHHHFYSIQLSMDDINEHKGNSSPSSLKQMLKSSLCLSCCFRKNRNQHHHHRRRMSLSSDVGDTPRSLMRSSSARDKSGSQGNPESKDKSRNFISRLGRHGRRHSASADFRYDALSYALNFDEGYDEGHLDDEFPLRNFSSRLPVSPRKSSPPSTSRQITAYS